MSRPHPPKPRPVIFPMPDDTYESFIWNLADGQVILETFPTLKEARLFCKQNKITPTIERECRYMDTPLPPNVIRFPIERRQSVSTPSNTDLLR